MSSIWSNHWYSLFFLQNISIKFEDNEEEFLPEIKEETKNHTISKPQSELDALVELIKKEPETPKKKKSEKRKKIVDENDNAVPQLKKSKKIKTEPI